MVVSSMYKVSTIFLSFFPLSKPMTTQTMHSHPLSFSLQQNSQQCKGFDNAPSLTLAHPPSHKENKKMSPLGCKFSRLIDYMKTIVITLSPFSAWANIPLPKSLGTYSITCLAFSWATFKIGYKVGALYCGR